MTVITTRIVVAADGGVSLSAPLPAGEYMASIEVQDVGLPPPFEARAANARLGVDRLPVFDMGPWPAGLSLSREDLYGDEGR